MANFNTPYGYGAYNPYNPSNNYQQQKALALLLVALIQPQ